MNETQHGISVRNKTTKQLTDFIPCQTGREALTILSGIRINMSPEYQATEETLTNEEISKVTK